jgi:hypothetical protein
LKLGKLIVEFRRAGGPKLTEEVFDALTDPEGEARAVIAKMARSAAKDFIDTEGGRILADVTAELEKRKAAVLAELGSAKPTVPTCIGCKTESFGAGITDFMTAPDCPVHGDPTVLKLIKEKQ